MARMDVEKRSKALQLRCGGMGYAKIGKELGCSTARAAKIIGQELQRLLASKGDVGEAARELELQRLDALLAAVWDRGMKGEAEAWDRCLAAIQARVKLMGLGTASGKKSNAPSVLVQIVESAAARPRVEVIEHAALPAAGPPDGEIVDPGASGAIGEA